MSDTLRAAAQQALEALENAEDQLAKPYSTDASNAIAALRAALAEPDVPETRFGDMPERLRTYSADAELSDRYSDAMQEAADEIERLTAAEPVAWSNEHYFALGEARCIGASDAYFKAWPIHDSHGRLVDCARESAAPAAPPQREPQWQPIETAPKDGTRVLIYMPEASRQKVLEAYWANPWEAAPDEQCWWSTPYGPAGRGYTILPKAVTHWMPLPDAPASAPKEQA